MYVVVEISPRTITRPVVVAVSQATRAPGVLADDRVQDRVADLVAHLVGVTLGHRLGGEEVVLGVDDAHRVGTASWAWFVRTEGSTGGPSDPATDRLEVEVALDAMERLVADRRRRRAGG